MSPKWTKSKIVIEITLPQMPCFCLWLVQELYGCWRTSCVVLIGIGLVLIVHGRILFSMFLFAYSLLGHENVKWLTFSRSQLACIHTMPISIFWCVMDTPSLPACICHIADCCVVLLLICCWAVVFVVMLLWCGCCVVLQSCCGCVVVALLF